MLRTALALAIGSTAIIGCSAKDGAASLDTPIAASAASAPSAIAPAPTRDEWLKAVTDTFYAKGKPETDDSGVTQYGACFDEQKGPKCETFAMLKHDNFKKVFYFNPFLTYLQKRSLAMKYLGSYVALPECSSPQLVIAPMLYMDSWIFLRQVAVMANDKLVLEFKTPDVERETDRVASGVTEISYVIASAEQINALREIAGGANVIVRFTGDKGFITMKKDLVKNMQDELRTVLKAYDKLKAAAASKAGAEC